MTLLSDVGRKMDLLPYLLHQVFDKNHSKWRPFNSSTQFGIFYYFVASSKTRILGKQLGVSKVNFNENFEN